jgi:hypothetical protein
MMLDPLMMYVLRAKTFPLFVLRSFTFINYSHITVHQRLLEAKNHLMGTPLTYGRSVHSYF